MIALIHELESIAERVFERKIAENPPASAYLPATAEAAALRDKLAHINAKNYISIAETALLLNCSDGHVRNLIGKARKGNSKQPIPFCDLDGVTVFNRLALIDWATQPKHTLEAIQVKDKTSNA